MTPPTRLRVPAAVRLWQWRGGAVQLSRVRLPDAVVWSVRVPWGRLELELRRPHEGAQRRRRRNRHDVA